MAGAKPSSIRWFAGLWLLQMGLTLLHGLASPDTAVAALAARLPDWDWSQPAPVIVSLVRTTISLLPLWLILSRASTFARWMSTFLAIIRLQHLPVAMAFAAEGSVLSIVWLAGLAAALAAVWNLFRPDAREWFAVKGKPEVRDAAVFD